MTTPNPRRPDVPEAPEITLEEALVYIKDLKPTPIGDTGFVVGPQALLDAAQRRAREALKAHRSRQQEGAK